MKYFFSLAALLIIRCYPINAQWIEIYSDSNTDFISDIKFLNNDTGYACGSVWPQLWSGIILKTINGGLTWDSVILGAGTGWMMSLSIVNKDIAYVGGQDGAVYKTTDGGSSWNWYQAVGNANEDLSTIHFLNPDTGFTIKFNGNIWQTANNTNWNGQQLGGHSYFPNTSSIQFLDNQTGFIANEKVFKTTDCGSTWQTLNLDSTLIASCIFMKNSSEGIVIGLNGEFARTMDGGNTFTQPEFLGDYALYDCAFINDTIGYIVGGNDYYNGLMPGESGIVYRTLDGGISWDSIQSFENSIVSLYFVNDSIGYAAGQGGKIYKISNANLVGINTVKSTNIFLASISPNPFKNFGVLHVENGKGSLMIYNALGSLVREEYIKNEYTIINRGQLSSGIYFYRIKGIGEIEISRKFIIE